MRWRCHRFYRQENRDHSCRQRTTPAAIGWIRIRMRLRLQLVDCGLGDDVWWHQIGTQIAATTTKAKNWVFMRAGDLSWVFSPRSSRQMKPQRSLVRHMPHNFLCGCTFVAWVFRLHCIALSCAHENHQAATEAVAVVLPTIVTNTNTMPHSIHINNAKICFHYQTSHTRIYLYILKWHA